MQIQGTSALVTGGASGLGAATARLLAQRGRAASPCSTATPAAGERLAARSAASSAPATSPTRRASRPRSRRAAAAHGPARILVNCAGIGTAARIVGRDGPMPLDAFERVVRVNLIGTFNVMRLAAAAMSTLPATGDRRARRHHLGRVGRRLRGPDRPGGLCRLEGRHRLADPAGGARVCPLRHPRSGDRTRPLPHAAAGGTAGGGASRARRVDPLPRPPRRAGRIRRARRRDDRQPLSQRRGRAPRRRAAHGAEVGAVSRSGLIGDDAAASPA